MSTGLARDVTSLKIICLETRRRARFASGRRGDRVIRLIALVSIVALVVVLLAVGGRLLSIATRTRKFPEFGLGLALVAPIVGYAVIVASALREGGTPAPAAMEIGGAAVDLGFVMAALFVWHVFRRKHAWARAVVVVLVVAGFAMPVIEHLVGGTGGVPATLWPRVGLRTACFGWGTVEATLYWRMMKRRLRLGLADPLVADRFRLWAAALALAVLAIDLLTIGGYLKLTGSAHAVWFTVAGASSGLPAAVLFWLSFFPPEAYRRWIETVHEEIEQ